MNNEIHKNTEGSSPFSRSSKLGRSPVKETREDGTPKDTPKAAKTRKNSVSEMLRDERGNLTRIEYAMKVARELTEFVNSKTNIHGDAKILALKVEKAICEVARELEESKADSTKMQKRPRTSPETTESPTATKRAKGQETPRAPKGDWQLVTTRRKEATQKPKNPMKTGDTKRVRPKADAILIGVKEGTQYADVLKKMREAPDLQKLGEAVSRVRRARGGEILLEFKTNSEVKSAEFKDNIEKALGSETTVKALTQQVAIECRNLDAITTAGEVWTALKEQGGLEVNQSDKPIRMRRSYGETQTATISLPAADANKLLQLGKVKIGWSVCTIKIVTQLLRCYKCTEYGHQARTCKGVDRSAACWKCGGDGHKALGCNVAPKCLLCKDGDNHHVAGSSRCGAYKAALLQRGWK